MPPRSSPGHKRDARERAWRRRGRRSPPSRPTSPSRVRAARGEGRGAPRAAARPEPPWAPAPSRKNSIESKQELLRRGGGSRGASGGGRSRANLRASPPGAPLPARAPLNFTLGRQPAASPDARVAAPPPPPLVRASAPPPAAARPARCRRRRRGAPFKAARPRGAGRRAGRAMRGARPSRSPPPPRAPLRPRPAPRALPGAAPARAELRAARPGGEGAGTGRAPGGARSNLAGPAALAACPAPERAKLGAGAGGGGPRRLPGAAEPLRSPTPPLLRPPRPARPRAPPSGALGWEGTRDAAGEGALSRYLPLHPRGPPHGVPTAPVC